MLELIVSVCCLAIGILTGDIELLKISGMFAIACNLCGIASALEKRGKDE